MSGCAVREVSAERIARFEREVALRRIPLEGTFALTHRCNLRCLHCYLGCGRAGGGGRPELTAAEVRRVLDELAEAGTLHLTLTGGEPLLRPDFPALYEHAVSAGLIVTVFTNATLVEADTVRRFRELPPRVVEVTVHGATPATCAAVTGVREAHERAMRGLRLLLDGGVRVRVKTALLRENAAEIDALEALASDLGIPFRFDTALFPPLPPGGGRAAAGRPIGEVRLEPAEAAALETATPRRRAPWLLALEEARPPGGPGRLFRCGAGLTNFHVDAEGYLSPCLLVPARRHDLRAGTFLEGWRGTIAALREIEAPAAFPCPDCPAAALCSACPGMFALETGSAGRVATYHCDTARARCGALGAHAILPPEWIQP